MTKKFFLTLSILIFISACGGGSGGSTSNAGSSSTGGTNTGQITDQLQIVE